MLLEKLTQDPIEAFFEKQRSAGGRSDNLSVNQFCLNTVSLRVQCSATLEPIRGNCGKRQCRTISNVKVLEIPLPKGLGNQND